MSHIGRFNKFQRIEIMQNVFCYNSRIQLEINFKNKIKKIINRKYLNFWKVWHILLINFLVREEFKIKIGKKIEFNDIEILYAETCSR